MDGDEALEHRMVTRTIEQAQTKVEGMNFDYRKHLVEYDDVLAAQRKLVYEDRNRILRGEDVRDVMMQLIEDELADLVDTNCASNHTEEWDTVTLYNATGSIFPMPEDLTPESMEAMTQDELTDALVDAANAAYEEREKALGEEAVRAWERRVLLVTMSGLWIHHVDAMDELREGALLQAFAQQDPLVAYKREAYDMFQQFKTMYRKNVVYQIFHILWQPTAALILQEAEPLAASAPEPAAAAPNGNGRNRNTEKTARAAAGHAKRAKQSQRVLAGSTKIGRNDPCYCGSGRKYKHCHGRT
jgi:preprotein translocase subunit SecA